MLPDPLHPALVHFPIVLALLAPFIAAAVFWAIRAARVPAAAWLGVIGLQAAILGVAWLTADTGHDEEERVERVVAESRIEEHEEAAERFLWLAGLTLPIAAAGLLRGPLGVGARGLTVVAGAVAAIAVAQVGHSGGELVYRYGAASAYTTGSGRTGAADAARVPPARGHADHD